LHVSSTALDFLAGKKESVRRTAKDFLRLRDAIEQVASNMLDTNRATPVRIFVKHVDRGQKFRGLP
jgi:hypothetical protein